MKKIGSEKKYKLNDFNIKIGTIDKKNTNVFYTEYSTYLRNINDNNINLITKNIESNFNKQYYDFVNKDKKIIDVDITKSLTDGLPSFLMIKIFNKTTRILEFNNIYKNIYNTIASEVIPDIYNVLNKYNITTEKTKK